MSASCNYILQESFGQSKGKLFYNILILNAYLKQSIWNI